MIQTGFTLRSFDLLTGLAANNSKDWFNAHRDDMRSHVQDPFAQLLLDVTNRLDGHPLPLIGSHKTMFRMHRDVRFSNDKTPYQAHVSGMLTASGTKQGDAGALYARMGPQGGVIGCGFYQLPVPQLNKVRRAMLAQTDRFQTTLDHLTAAGLALSTDDMLKTMPRGFADQADHPLSDVLRRKNIVVFQDQPKAVWLDGRIADRLVAMADAMADLIRLCSLALTQPDAND